MARLFTDGAETGDTTRIVMTGGSANSSIKRVGNYSYVVRDWNQNIIKPLGSTFTEIYARFAAYIIGAGTNDFFGWLGSGTYGGRIRVPAIGSAGQITAFVGGSQVAASPALPISGSAWHVYEVHFLLSTNATIGKIQVKFDGTQVIDYTGNTAAAIANMDTFKWFDAGNQNTYFDDIAINDTTGGGDNSWCGDGGVLAALVPNGVGTYSDLIASTGSAYTCVDEIPANDTDYAYETTVDKKSTYAMSNLAGLPAGATIRRVWHSVLAKETAAAGDKIAVLSRSGTTDSQGSDQALTLGNVRYLSPEYLVDPDDSAAWTENKVNALEAGAVVR